MTSTEIGRSDACGSRRLTEAVAYFRHSFGKRSPIGSTSRIVFPRQFLAERSCVQLAGEASRETYARSSSTAQSDPKYLLRKPAAATQRSENTRAANIDCDPAFFRIPGQSLRSSRYIFIIWGTVGCAPRDTNALQTSLITPRTVPP